MQAIEQGDERVDFEIHLINNETNLDELNASIASFLKTLSLNYIYHIIGPSLTVVRKESEGEGYIKGTMRFGDHIVDEWFFVWQLKKLSLKFPVIIKMTDNDGQFLLIEAALSLPDWITPELMEEGNRVWMFNGDLHIVPVPSLDIPNIPMKPTLRESINMVTSTSIPTIAEDVVRECIDSKLSTFPKYAYENQHKTKMTLPKQIAQILYENPQMVSLAVEAFYKRDIKDNILLSQMRTFHPSNKSNTKVMVQLNRCMYAQLNHQPFTPPRVFEFSDIENDIGEEEKAEILLGVKITSGFEILCSKLLRGDKCKESFEKFISSLEESGYFRNEIEGSKLYKDLFSSAKTYYDSTFDSKEEGDGLSVREREDNEVTSMLSILLSLNSSSTTTFCDVSALKSDDCAWLNVKEDELEKLLKDKMSQYTAYDQNMKNEVLSESESENEDEVEIPVVASNLPKEMVNSLNAFVNEVSSYEGVEMERNNDSEYFEEPMQKEEGISFNLDTFYKILKTLKDGGGEEEFGESTKMDEIIVGLMHEMDNELFSNPRRQVFISNILDKSFTRAIDVAKEESKEKETEDYDEMNGLDVDVNLVQNLLESFSLQNGYSGPASNLLRDLGVGLEQGIKE